MMHSIPLNGKTYGVGRYPANWQELMDQYVKLQVEDRQSDLPEFNNLIRLVINFYDKDGDEAFPEHSFNGNGYSTGNNFLDDPFFVQANELEGAY
ncbi:hypothetical protein [Peribacillus simplex]|uniref:hypothetical protein n=1 Tax=Peribacillus simplex TaxID=1478 RepID=UPI003D2D68D0